LKKTLTTEEALAELFVSTYKYLDKTTKSTIEFYEKQYKMYEKYIVEHLEEEPPKLFKKSHKKWEEKLTSLKEKHDELFGCYLEECEELYKLHTLTANA